MLPSLLHLVLTNCLFLSSPPPKPCVHLSFPPYVLHAPPISLFWIWSPTQYLVSSTNHKAPRYVVFSTLLLPRPSQAKIYFSAPCSQTHLACVAPSMWEWPRFTLIQNSRQSYGSVYSSSIGTTAHCRLWPVEQYPSFFSYLPPTLSIFSLQALEDLFRLPLSIFSWVFPFFSSFPVLEWRSVYINLQIFE